MTKSPDNGMGIFADLISEDFDNIKKSFINRSKSAGYTFDEDLFMDSYINCQIKLSDKQMTKIECVKYFWVAYHNKLRTPHQKLQTIELTPDIEKTYSYNDDSYQEIIESKYNKIIDILKKKYDIRLIDAWVLHMCEHKTYRELYDMGYTFNFKNNFKQINQYLRKKFKQ